MKRHGAFVLALSAVVAATSACSSSDSGAGGSLACTSTVASSEYCYTYVGLPASVTASEICPGGNQVSSCPTADESGCCTGVPITAFAGATEGYCVYSAPMSKVSAEQSACELLNGTWSTK